MLLEYSMLDVYDNNLCRVFFNEVFYKIVYIFYIYLLFYVC